MKVNSLLQSLALSCGLLAPLFTLSQNPVNEGIITKMYPVKQVPKAHTIQFNELEDPWQTTVLPVKVLPAPGEEMEMQRFNELKRQLNEQKAFQAAKEAAERGETAPAPKTNGGNAPVLGHNFFGNIFDGIPNDNSLTVSNGGKILSATNSRLDIYRVTGVKLATKTLASFFSNSTLVYDPRVTYDPEWGRFILVYLSGDNSAESRVVVCFTETSDPQGAWHVYPLIGNPDPATFGNVWTDYPQIALTRTELIITGNLFYDNLANAGVSYIWQIKKRDGYNGASALTVREWSAAGVANKFSLTPCEGSMGLTGPGIYFVSTPNSPFSTISSIYLHHINDTLDGAPTFTTYTLFSDLSYGVAPDADQMGTSQQLDTRGTRIRSAYLQDSVIHFGMNATRTGKCQIYYGTITGLRNPTFAAATGQYVAIDSFDIGYPAMAYGGQTSTTGKTSSLVCFNFSSPDHYPGNACVFIDTNGVQSAPTINKYGFTWIQRMTNPERWGDYAEVAAKFDNPGEYWFGGYFGYNTSSHYHGTWISQIFLNGAAPIAVEPSTPEPAMEMEVFPNPTAEAVQVKLIIPETKLYTASVMDLNGKEIKLLFRDNLRAGESVLQFQTEALAAGTYLVVVRSDSGVIASEKLVVTK